MVIDLNEVFGDSEPAPPQVPANVQPQVPADPSASPPALAGFVVAVSDDPDDWLRDSVPWPDPCPRCGSLEKWWTMFGVEKCQACDADALARGLRILRPTKMATRRGPQCDAAGLSDSQHVGGDRPPAAAVRASRGCELG